MRDRLRRTVERHPLLWVALVAAAGVLTGDGKITPGLLCGAALLALLAYTGLRRFTLAALLVAVAAGGLHGWRKSRQDADAARLERIRSAEITARLLSEPRSSLRGWSAVAEVMEGGHVGQIWLQAEGRVPACGEVLQMKGRYEPLPLRRNPGTFDVFPWLYRQGICACFEALEIPRQVAAPSGFHLLENRARNAFRHAVTDGLDPEGRQAAVIRAMVLGDNPDNDQELIGAYRNSGTLHAFSVSGMHVAMVGLIGWFVLKLFGMPRRGAVVVILVGMLAYAWVTGMKPPAVRSVVMAGALLGAFLVRRRPDLLNALGFALLAAVLTNGHLIFQAGVQLSFGVVWAIGIGAALAAPAFAWIERREPYLPRQLYGPGREAWLRSREKTAAALAASTAASVGSVPLTLWHFGFLAPISILASPLIGMPILVLMALALLAVVCSPFPAASQAVNRANGYVADSCTALAGFFARIPGGNFSLPLDRPGNDFLIIYDPGYGGGAALIHEQGQTVLIDTGSRAAFQRIVGPSMRRLAVLPDSIALSHPDGGHIGGAVDAALGPYPIRQVLIPVNKARSSVFREVLKTTEAKHIPTTLGGCRGALSDCRGLVARGPPRAGPGRHEHGGR
ncbi:ComEC/Rec2 family competence protein [Haloferula sp. BvORR071]|uniref:ComEC/Rec2 family competence protein n=1 Tax=Haloferula sp. BvORR071 TaxID=1396141 RepID=UPI00054DA35D|nr:ComEC/Rec2 family competence protein [Haloferula sp. BvORR071]